MSYTIKKSEIESEMTPEEQMEILSETKLNIGNACFELIIKPIFFNTVNKALPRLHCHPSYEVQCIERGTVKIRFESNTYVVQGPALILIPPKTYHIFENISEDAIKYSFEYLLSMNGTGDSFRKFSDLLENVTAPEILSIPFPSVEAIRAYENRPEEFRFMVTVHVGQIILKIFDALSEKHQNGDHEMPGRKSNLKQELAVAEIMAYMEEHSTQPLTLSVIAEKYNYSERQIERMFKEVMHDSFFSLLNKYRIRMASIKITKGETNLAKVAEECGFANYVTFWNHFTKLNGMTPSEFQKRKLK